MKRNIKHSGESTRLAVIFLVFVFIFIAISLIFRLGALIAKSAYNNNNRFTISIENNKNLKIMSISGKSKSLSLLEITNSTKDLNKAKFLATPIDAHIITSLDIDINKAKVPDLIYNFILNYGNIKTNLTIIDMARIYMSVRSIIPADIDYRSISSSLDSEEIDKIVFELFKDEEIENEKLTIRIINTTKVNGFGARLGRLISNMGGNVVLIESADKEEAASNISYFGNKNYTVKKLGDVLGYTTIQTPTISIADIVITIGADSIDTSIF